MLGPHPSDTGMCVVLSCGRISLDLIMRMTISFGSRNRKDGLLASKRTLTVTLFQGAGKSAFHLILIWSKFGRSRQTAKSGREDLRAGGAAPSIGLC